MRLFQRGIILLLLVNMAACSQGGDPTSLERKDDLPGLGPPTDVAVSWRANREKGVNQPGGGYRVYYSLNANTPLASTPFIDVPFDPSRPAPTAVIRGLSPGRYSIRVVAYSSLFGGKVSAPSPEMILSVP